MAKVSRSVAASRPIATWLMHCTQQEMDLCAAVLNDLNIVNSIWLAHSQGANYWWIQVKVKYEE